MLQTGCNRGSDPITDIEPLVPLHTAAQPLKGCVQVYLAASGKNAGRVADTCSSSVSRSAPPLRLSQLCPPSSADRNLISRLGSHIALVEEHLHFLQNSASRTRSERQTTTPHPHHISASRASQQENAAHRSPESAAEKADASGKQQLELERASVKETEAAAQAAKRREMYGDIEEEVSSESALQLRTDGTVEAAEAAKGREMHGVTNEEVRENSEANNSDGTDSFDEDDPYLLTPRCVSNIWCSASP